MTMYVDRDFPYSAYPLGAVKENGKQRQPVEWLRPQNIVRRLALDPVFMDHEAGRFDLNQGEIGDCWFVAGVISVVTSRQQQLIDRCIPPGQNFQHNYTGKFRFKFWHFGEWKEVEIDDKLPTVNGKLIYARNESQPNEFWVPLLEKAYAKLCGGYHLLQGGISGDAIVDLTGGISEKIELNTQVTQDPAQRHQLFTYLNKMMDACSTLSCSILPKTERMLAEWSCFENGHGYSVAPHTPQIRREAQRQGIVLAHAYSIIKLAVVPVPRSRRVDEVMLICLHNPWGKYEWTGSWSDGSSEWDLVSERVKLQIGYNNQNDGEFWMSFEDFASIFDHIWVCHLPSDPTTTRIANTENWWQWEQFMKSGLFSAQVLYEAEIGGLAVISLLQKTERGRPNIDISFKVIRESDGRTVAEVSNSRQREVVKHLELSKGSYYICPSATSAGDKEFLLRVFAKQVSVPRF